MPRIPLRFGDLSEGISEDERECDFCRAWEFIGLGVSRRRFGEVLPLWGEVDGGGTGEGLSAMFNPAAFASSCSIT